MEEASPSHAEGAFVLFKSGSFRPILGVIITGMQELEQYNAFIGELFSGLAMSQFRSGLPGVIPAWLDCESVLSGMEQRLPSQSDYYANLHKDYGPILHQFHRLRRSTSHPPIQWTRGHPDQSRVKPDGTRLPAIPRAEWGVQEYGIYIADHLADLTEDAERQLSTENLLPQHIIRVPIDHILKAIPTAGQWLRCLRTNPDLPIVLPQRQLADQRIFRDYCNNRDNSSIRPPRWRHIQIGLLKPTLKVLKAWGWASTWAKYIRIILDKGKNAPIATCPLCLQGIDELEHFLCCEHHLVTRARQIFHAQLLQDISAYCRKKKLSLSARSLAQDYAKACTSPMLDVNDRIGGWLAIPSLRFLHFFSPDIRLTDTVMKDLLLVLPRVTAAHIQWIDKIWRYRCKLIHAPNSQGSSTNTSIASGMLAAAGRITSFTKLTRGQGTHPDPSSADRNNLSQLTIDSFSDGDMYRTQLGGSSVQQLAVSHIDDDVHTVFDTVSVGHSGDGNLLSPLDSILEDQLAEHRTFCEGSVPQDTEEETFRDIRQSSEHDPLSLHGSGQEGHRFKLRSLRGSTELLEQLVWDHAPRLARSWDELPDTYLPFPYASLQQYELPAPLEIRIGPSSIPGAGLGIFLFTADKWVPPGTMLGRYIGNDTVNGGLPLAYLAPGCTEYPEARDGGSYLLRHNNYMVDASPDCAMGYINEGWSKANSFFQPDPACRNSLISVTWCTFPPNGVYEILTNYSFQYWLDRMHLLSGSEQRECFQYYNR